MCIRDSIRDDDNFLAQVSQAIIFFSLVSSVVTNAFPEDPVMQVLLPVLLAMPVILTIIFYVLVLVCPCTTSKVTSKVTSKGSIRL